MSYYIWILLNALIIIGTSLYIWLVNPHPSMTVRSGQFIAQMAIILFFVNLNMYFILLVIREAKKQSLRVTLAKIARRMMKWHIPIALFATSLIIIHAIIMLTKLGSVMGYAHLKMISGYIAIAALSITLFGGYRRYKKASGFRRKFHYITAFCFGALFLLHIFIPI